MAEPHPTLTFWLLMVSLASLVTVSSVIFYKNIWVNDDAKTTVKYTETAADNGADPGVKPAGQSAADPSVNLTADPAAATTSETVSEKSSPDRRVTNQADTNESSAGEQRAAPTSTEAFGFADVTYLNHIVSGRVAGLDADEYAEYAVVLFIWVDGQPYIKPTWADAKAYLDSTGYFEIPAYTNDQNKYNDQQNATAYSLFLTREDFDPLTLSSFSDIVGVQEAALLSADELPTGN